ncbi:immunoglobulin-like domain-containing protein [uncultured Aquimarina sp.]|uniref:immunoglobulin-like domain-containing protein n=1 Tax=uncultured Aquimarina sp. TaxID=575652 RepID=UPI0026074A1D|nr:immunoglobulin-like domain-containing protein [uncultured Aquimarina sp.]
MKKLSKYFLVSIILSIVIMACTKEITDDLIISFEATFSETTLDSFLNTPSDIEFSITDGLEQPENFSIKYKVSEGSGIYLLNDQLIEEDQFIVLSNLTNTISYTGTTVGSNKVIVVIKDQYQREKEFVLTYNVKDTAFDMEIVPTPSAAYIGGVIDLDFNIINEISPADYTISYKFVNTDGDGSGNGIMYKEGEVLNQNEPIDINQGNTFTWQLEGTIVGDLAIEFIVKSSLNATVEKSITIPVTETPDFTFTVETLSSELATNSNATLNFKITETIGNSSYKMMYDTSNQGVFTFNEVVYQPGDEIPVEAGDFSGFYTGTEMGSHDVTFKVINANTLPLEKTGSLLMNYTDPDTEAPFIELIGEAEITIRVGEEYNDQGIIVTDNVDVEIDIRVEIMGMVDIQKPETYVITYTATDTSENSSFITRKVTVIDDEAPVITLIGDNPITIFVGATFTDPGVMLSDNVDTIEMLQENLTITGNVNTNLEGDYTIMYSVTDSSDNMTNLNRVVKVVNDAPPVIRILGQNPLTFNATASYTDAGVEVSDDIDQNLTVNIENNVISNDPGNYKVIYTVKDSGDNMVRAERDVTVIDTEAPVITLSVSESGITHRVNTSFTNPTAVVTDNAIDPLTAVISGSVDTTTLGENTLTYTATDESDNTTIKNLKVNVIDDVAPTIELIGERNIFIQVGGTYTEQGVTVSDNFNQEGEITVGLPLNLNVNIAGLYELKYTATDRSGNSASVSRFVQVFNKPVARFSPRNVTGQSPLTITFNAGGSESDGIIINARWNFGDGSPEVNSDFRDNVTHTFTGAPGTVFNVGILITDEFGGTDITGTTVTITN